MSFPQCTDILQNIMASVAASDVPKMMFVEKTLRKGCKELWPTVAAKREFPEWWSLQKAAQVESASFYDGLDSPKLWRNGPNMKLLQRPSAGATEKIWQGNSFQSGPGGQWLWISDGVDWSSFQGGFRQVSNDGMRPSWVSFRVQISTPALSSAFLVLAGEKNARGIEHMNLLFQYRGDESSKDKRCFAVQTKPAQRGGVPVFCKVEPEILCNRPYEVAIRFDWAKGHMSVFIDGIEYVKREAFDVTVPIRYVSLYNWRSGARAAFSELTMGPALPCMVPIRRKVSRAQEMLTEFVEHSGIVGVVACIFLLLVLTTAFLRTLPAHERCGECLCDFFESTRLGIEGNVTRAFRCS